MDLSGGVTGNAGIMVSGYGTGGGEMTGEKNKFVTQEKLWKIDDEQLATPKHDELVLMLLNEDFVNSKIIQRTLGEDLPEIPVGMGDWSIEIESESPIKSSNGFIIGYWDVVVKCHTDYNELTDSGDLSLKYIERVFCIECKPTTPSFGKVLRQLTTYTSYPPPGYLHRTRFKKYTILFTPDLRFKSAFESQGVVVISP